jgi:Cd2+/Zn2+-exporting ATPase
MKKETWFIKGLDCAEEVKLLKNSVGKLEGVESLDCNILKGTMTVIFNPELLNQEKIVLTVKNAGLAAEQENKGSSQVERSLFNKIALHSKSILCLLSALFLITGVIAHYIAHGTIVDAILEGHHGEHSLPIQTIALFLAAIISGGWFVFPKAIKALLKFRADMNLLMAIAVIGAIIIGEWFEAATVTFLFSLSLLLESWSVNRARNAISSLLNLSPPKARYICPHDGDIMERNVDEVMVGTTVLVRPGERIPLDGIVTKGSTYINQAAVTGESIPVEKNVGDEVFAGTINEHGAFEFRSIKSASHSTISRIIKMVEEAQSRRAQTEQWVEKFAHYYTPIMILIAVLVAVVPPLITGENWGRWFYEALVILVIACPCALVISTPVSIVAALAASARMGVLVKGGVFLEIIAGIKAIAIDKTGTLTNGRPQVQMIIPLDKHSDADLLRVAVALESQSNHPIAKAIVNKAVLDKLDILPVTGYREYKGAGAEGCINDRLYWLGSHRMMTMKKLENNQVLEYADKLEDSGHTIVIIGTDDHICGLISVADTVRKEAVVAISQMHKSGIKKVIILTGDNEGTAEGICKLVLADGFEAELLPEDKITNVNKLKEQYGAVAMIGDGVNDAPALATATVGIAMGTAGSDAAMETADIALLSNDLTHIAWLIRHGKRTLSIIRQNIYFAISIKLVFMILAVSNLATLWMAIAADTGASLLVVINALRLLKGKKVA